MWFGGGQPACAIFQSLPVAAFRSAPTPSGSAATSLGGCHLQRLALVTL